MPKPLIDETDPNLHRLNEVLVDFITRNLRAVNGETLVLIDFISIISSPITIVIAIVNEALLLASMCALGLLLALHLEVVSLQVSLLLVASGTIVLSKRLRHQFIGLLFQSTNMVTFGFLIKTIARGYQVNEPVSHYLLRSSSPVFSLLGTYVEALDTQKRNQYHGYIDKYQSSRYGDKNDFELLMSGYWKDANK